VLAASIRKSCFLSFCSAMSSARWCGWRRLICSCQTPDTLAGDKVEPGEGTGDVQRQPSVIVASPFPPGRVQRCFNHRFIPCFPGNGGKFYPFLCSSPLGPSLNIHGKKPCIAYKRRCDVILRAGSKSCPAFPCLACPVLRGSSEIPPGATQVRRREFAQCACSSLPEEEAVP
jgi:hypothetical protein